MYQCTIVPVHVDLLLLGTVQLYGGSGAGGSVPTAAGRSHRRSAAAAASPASFYM